MRIWEEGCGREGAHIASHVVHAPCGRSIAPLRLNCDGQRGHEACVVWRGADIPFTCRSARPQAAWAAALYGTWGATMGKGSGADVGGCARARGKGEYARVVPAPVLILDVI